MVQVPRDYGVDFVGSAAWSTGTLTGTNYEPLTVWIRPTISGRKTHHRGGAKRVAE